MKFYIGRSIGQHLYDKKRMNWQIFDNTESCHVNIGDFYLLFEMNRDGVGAAFALAGFFQDMAMDMALALDEKKNVEDQAADIREEEDGIAEAIDIEVEQLDDVEVADA